MQVVDVRVDGASSWPTPNYSYGVVVHPVHVADRLVPLASGWQLGAHWCRHVEDGAVLGGRLVEHVLCGGDEDAGTVAVGAVDRDIYRPSKQRLAIVVDVVEPRPVPAMATVG